MIITLLSLCYRVSGFVANFRNGDFWWIYMFWGPLNPKVSFLLIGLFSVCVCSQHNSNYRTNSKFDILHLYPEDATCNILWILIKLSVHRGTQNNYNTLRPTDVISCYFILVYLDCIKYNEINVHFCHTQKHVINRMVYEYH